MRKILVIIIILCLLLTTVSLSHSGKTDSSGGHYNMSTGEYHYHHGYPAHQHINGICPYDSSGTSNIDNIPYSNYTTNINTISTQVLKDTIRERDETIDDLQQHNLYLEQSVTYVLIGATIVVIIVAIVFYKIRCKKLY